MKEGRNELQKEGRKEGKSVGECLTLLALGTDGLTAPGKVAIGEIARAERADKASGMPVLVECLDHLVGDGLAAAAATLLILRKQVAKVVGTVRMALVLDKLARVEGLLAMRADKAFRVPALAERLQSRARDRLGASTAQRRRLHDRALGGRGR